ncbi:hypothetical protein DFQ10_102249 [Winogradskyella eximia]|uniref:Uncharacterized protein n=1 Tax=Winogradskyella eximia TaxID=262006 RepID=A0A3D9H886_9FLAO|nr:hypothetical protein [Winogradskyella eximia]RED45381.1 hypothetical protein DFQ10_102249 [Winogradskyella eximia]
MNLKLIITSVFNITAIVLALAVLLPSAVKLTHAFNHHKHEVCDKDNDHQTHFHESDLDCDFYKFKLTTQYYKPLQPFEIISIVNNFKISKSQYEFVSDFQRLQTALRGPPQMI